MSKSGLKLLAYSSVLVVVIALVSAFHGETMNDEPVEDNVPVHLNETLTNEMSESPALEGMERPIDKFMGQWQLHGIQLSVIRNDSLLFSRGYGEADDDVQMDPTRILRLASVSKLVTATGIMLLKERGLLSLSDTVFGPGGILNDTVYCNSIRDKNYYRITVEHLMRHQGGFSDAAGDPMFSTRTIMLQNHLETPPTPEKLLQIVLKRRLRFMPGTSQSYSNFGYLLLSMIIEKKTGMSYEDFIQENVLRPAGCVDFHLANNYYSEKYSNESRYYVPSNEPLVDEYDCSGKMVERCYGGNDVHALSGAGAWVASSAELARFVASIDGRDGVPDIISRESVREMTEYTVHERFSLGWNDTDPEVGWTRTGTMSGTSAYIKYYLEHQHMGRPAPSALYQRSVHGVAREVAGQNAKAESI
jgi:CubicO group peptidase (beta-lactamase class C family)